MRLSQQSDIYIPYDEKVKIRAFLTTVLASARPAQVAKILSHRPKNLVLPLPHSHQLTRRHNTIYSTNPPSTICSIGPTWCFDILNRLEITPKYLNIWLL